MESNRNGLIFNKLDYFHKENDSVTQYAIGVLDAVSGEEITHRIMDIFYQNLIMMEINLKIKILQPGFIVQILDTLGILHLLDACFLSQY